MMEKQIKDLAWNTFKQTGNINTFMEFMQIKNMEKSILENDLKNIEDLQYGDNQGERNHSFRK